MALRTTGHKNGFTLIELVIVMAVVVTLSALVYANYREISEQGRILGLVQKIKSDLQMAQSNALSGRGNNGSRSYGWGVNFDRTSNKYILYADMDQSKAYNFPTKLLIHGSETLSGSVITESSHFARTITVTGATRTNDYGIPPSVLGYWSFDGTSDKLVVPASDDFNFGTGDFTIDFWFYASVTGAKKALLYKGNGAGTQSFAFYRDSDDLLKFTIYDTTGTAFNLQSDAARLAISADTWYHAAVTREGTVLRLFLNGRPHDVETMTTEARSQSVDVQIGIEDDGSTNSWNGRLDEIRVAKGFARWRELFIPPQVIEPADDEVAKEVKLPPDIVFERLYSDGVGANSLSVFFYPSDYMMYANALSVTDSAKVIINNFGVEGSDSSGDTPQTIRVYGSGLISVE